MSETGGLAAYRLPLRVFIPLWGICLAIFVMCCATRVRAYFFSSLWYDEAFSRILASEMSFNEMVTALRSDVHPPAYFMALRVWSAVFGDDILTIRAFSAVMSGLTAVGLFILTLEICRQAKQSKCVNARLVSPVFLGMSVAALYIAGVPFIVESQQAKAYSFGTALLVWSSVFLVRMVSAPRRAWVDYLMYGLLAGILTVTHPFGIFSVTSQLLFLVFWVVCRIVAGNSVFDVLTRRVFIAVLLSVAPYCLWLPTVLVQTARVQSNYWISPFQWSTLPSDFAVLLFPSAIGPYMAGIGLLLLMALFVMSLGTIKYFAELPGLWLSVMLLWGPLTITVIVSTFVASVCTPRYLIFASVFVPVLFVVGLSLLLPRVLFIGLCLMSLGNQILYTELYLSGQRLSVRGGSQELVSQIAEMRQADEPVLVFHPATFFVVKYYSRGRFEPLLYLGDLDTLPHFLGGPLLRYADTLSEQELSQFQQGDVWCINTTGFSVFTPARMPASWRRVLASRMEQREAFDWQGLVSAEKYVRLNRVEEFRNSSAVD